MSEIAPAAKDILAGKIRSRQTDEKIKRAKTPVTVSGLGLVLVPDVLNKTPPFVDRVLSNSPAEKAGLRPDDLVLFVGSRVVTSCKALVDELSAIEQGDEVPLTVQRKQEILPLTIPGGQ